MSELYPLLGDISMGGLSGFCVGYFAKRFLKIVAFVLGGYLASLMYLNSRGAITVNYDKIWEIGEGAISKISDLQMSIAPLGLSFVGGFVLGLRQS